MRVPFLDLAAASQELRDELMKAVARVVDSGRYVLGPELETFEAEFAAFVGAEHCVAVGSGLDALTLALRAWGIGRGHEVVVPSNVFIATWLAVSRVGAVPVPAEPDPETYNLDPTALEAALTGRTRAVIPVHQYGQPAEMDAIAKVADANGLRVLEDAAQAHGAAVGGRRVGGLGHTAAWSFYPSKNLGALGDGGAVTTDDRELAERIRLLRNYGAATKYANEAEGVNSRLGEVQAAVLAVKLRHLEEWNARRRVIADRYLGELAGTELVLPQVPAWADPVWHLFVVRHAARDALRAHLERGGVETLIHYPVPPHRQAVYRRLDMPAGAFPVAERLSEEVLSLPIGPHLSQEHAGVVVDAMRAALAEQA
ncbi:MAG: DegT/DnrJ/EryC1/StrS family aminotransferase [Actinomycetota bacterium]